MGVHWLEGIATRLSLEEEEEEEFIQNRTRARGGGRGTNLRLRPPSLWVGVNLSMSYDAARSQRNDVKAC